MAATNFTPIQLYFSTTASAVPLAANLAQGELAINITDGKLYYEDNAGAVQVIATKGAGTIGGSTTQIQYNNAGVLAGNAAMVFNNSTNVTTLTTLNLTNALGAIYGGTAQSTYTQGDILYSSASNTLAKLGIGANTYILTSTGSIPQWVAPSSIAVLTATNLAGGLAGSVPYQSALDTTTFLAIGAANRVMTSSGTAPQWVTSLTGLTGVSSSSITNTSLTSGRVVVSTTAGLQADDADLTFDGTTLSAGGFSTVGLSTLVKTVKIGDSSFNGVAVFAAATPAKLYMGTGTVTDVTSAISATNAIGAIASLGITPIAATNTSVTYTNAATLYIAGAPSAGTNVTLTNPYALYVAAGDAFFGGTVTAGTVNLTTLDLTNLEVTNIKAKDGTAAMSIADTTGIVSFTANPILSGGTANGVLYLNGSKSATSGTALAFDGANLSVGAASALYSSRLTVAYSAASSNGPFIADTRAFGADRGGALWLGGQYNTAGNYRPYGGFVGAKETATDGNSLGYLAFYVNKNAADAAEAGRFNSSGSFLVGANTPFNATADVGLFVRPQASISRVIIDNQDIAGTSSFEMSSYGGGWSLQVPGSATFVNQLDFKFGNLQRVRYASSGIIGFGTQGTTADRLVDMSFQGVTTSGANQFGIVLNPTYPTTPTSSIFNLYIGPNLTAGTTVTSVFGLYLEGINAVGSTVTNRYGVYQSGASDRNYFAGPVGVGTVTTSLGSINLAGSAALGITSGTTGDYLSSGGGNNSTYNGLAILSNSRAIATQANTSLPSWIVDVGGRAADGSTYNPNTANKFRVAYVAAGGSYYSASNFFAITSAGNVGVNQITPTTRLAVTLNEGEAASMTSYSPGTGAVGYNQGEIRECSFNVDNAANFVISSIVTTSSGWRVIFRGTWSNNFEGGGLVSPPSYIEVNAANPSVIVGSRTLTVSRNGSGFLIVNTTDSYRISFAGTVEVYENPQSSQPDQSMRLLGGIQFPATQSASSNANTLDDYEEGTWTPTYVTSGTGFTSITYNTTFTGGQYVKIGQQVFLTGYLRTEAITIGAASGFMSIGGLPFPVGTSGASTYYRTQSTISGTTFASNAPVQANPSEGLSSAYLLYLQAIGSATTLSALSVADMATGANSNIIQIGITYLTTT